MKMRSLAEVRFQVVAPPVGQDVFLEFLDENDVAFLAINIDEAGVRHAVMYGDREAISIRLADLKKGIEIAEREVKNIDPESLVGD